MVRTSWMNWAGTGSVEVEYPDHGETLFKKRKDFREGKPVGLMIRYYETGAIRAKIYHDPLLTAAGPTLLQRR